MAMILVLAALGAATVLGAAAAPTLPTVRRGSTGAGSLLVAKKRNPAGSGCTAVLQRTCGDARASVFVCAECAGSHQRELRQAGCSNQAISSWCSGIDPPDPNDTELHQERVLIVTRHGIRVPFAPVEHQPATIFSRDPARKWFADPQAWGATKIAELTPHGKHVIALMGAHMAEVVLPTRPYNFTVYADLDHTNRDIQTAEAFMRGAYPEAGFTVDPWDLAHPEYMAKLMNQVSARAMGALSVGRISPCLITPALPGLCVFRR